MFLIKKRIVLWDKYKKTEIIYTISLYFSSSERTSSSIFITLLSRSCRLSAKCDDVDNNSNGVFTASPSSSRRAEKCVRPQVISCCMELSASVISWCSNLFLTYQKRRKTIKLSSRIKTHLNLKINILFAIQLFPSWYVFWF